MKTNIKRVYDLPDPTDGFRVLVDRLWPRGLTKENAAVNFWAKDLTPSNDLRRWFAHDERKFEEFTLRYRVELGGAFEAVDELVTLAAGRTITLVYAAKSETCNHAIVLQAWLQQF